MSAPIIRNEITRLKSEIALLEEASLAISSFVNSPNATSNIPSNAQQLSELAENLRVVTSNTEKTIAAIKNSFNNYPKQLTDKEKYELWKLLLKYCQLTDRSIKALNHITGSIEKMPYSTSSDIGKVQDNLTFIRSSINAMKFDTTHLYRRSNLPIDASRQSLEDFSFADQAIQPTIIDKIIAKICVKALTDVAQKKQDTANIIKNILLSAPNNVHNFSLKIDASTTSKALEYINPIPTDKWLIVVGGAGASYADMLTTTKEIADHKGYNFLVVDYLAKKPNSFADPVKIIVTAAKYLIEKKGVKPEALNLIGHSNGGRIVTQAAAYLPGCNVITNNTYTSLEEVIIGHVMNAVVSLRNQGVPISHHLTTIINAVIRFFEQHGLDKKAIDILRNALEKTGNGYQSEQTKSNIPAHKFAAVYTAPDTEYDERNVKLSKVKDNVLLDAIDGKMQVKKAKLHDPDQHQLLKEKTIPLNDQFDIDAIKYKADSHLVLKGVTPSYIENPHNVINARLLCQAIEELEKQNTKKPATLQEQFEELLANHGLTQETEQLLPSSGIELDQHERFTFMKVMTHLNRNSAATWPTQDQLMRLFQANDFAADMISRYSAALEKMLQGERGQNFLHARLVTLNKRTESPNPHLYSYGSYLNKNLADLILKRLHAYYDKHHNGNESSDYLNRLPTYHINMHALFSGTDRKATRVKQQPVTVSDLDLTEVLSTVPVCA